MIVLLWVGLVLALLVTLGANGWMLVRKFLRLLEAFAELLAKPAILDGVHRPAPAERALPAVLEARSIVKGRYDDVALLRQERRVRRVLARRERGLALISARPTALN